MAEAATVAGVAAKAAGRGTERMGNDEASPKVDKRGTTILVPIGLVIVCAVMVALMAQRPGHADTGPWQWDGTTRSEVVGKASVRRISRRCRRRGSSHRHLAAGDRQLVDSDQRGLAPDTGLRNA